MKCIVFVGHRGFREKSSCRQFHKAFGVEGRDRIPSHLPIVAIRVAKIAAVPAPKDVLRRLDDSRSAGVLACGSTRRLVGYACWRRDAPATRSRDDCATLVQPARRL